MQSSDRESGRAEKHALAVQWVACGAILIGFAEMLAARIDMPNALYGRLYFFACLKPIIGTVTWHRASETGD